MTINEVAKKLMKNHKDLSMLAKKAFLDIYNSWSEIEQVNKMAESDLETYVYYPRTRIMEIFSVSYNDSRKAFNELIEKELIREEKSDAGGKDKIVYINFENL